MFSQHHLPTHLPVIFELKYANCTTYKCFYHGEEGIFIKKVTITILTGFAG